MGAKEVTQPVKFELGAYKRRIKDVIKAAGGPVALANKLQIEYQLIQGWANGSIPRQKDWPIVEKTGKGMAWYLFGITSMPDPALDTEALAAAVAKLREQLDELEAICSGLISPKKEKHRPAPRLPDLRPVKKIVN